MVDWAYVCKLDIWLNLELSKTCYSFSFYTGDNGLVGAQLEKKIIARPSEHSERSVIVDVYI